MVKAMVIWVKPEDGGKKKIPTIELPFYPMIKINDDNKMIDWSLCLTNKQFISEYETISEIGFLMGNAPKELKGRFPNVTDSNDEDGIYKALKQIGLIS